jgi:predicted O-methyltransferase YrrM
MVPHIKRLLEKSGIEIVGARRPRDFTKPFSALLQFRHIVDLEALARVSLSIPGMISPRSGQFLYTLCYMQEVQGDVVEIGSWQGRSTSFLARAVKNSGNGALYAIDHFKGNAGKVKYYVVGSRDLSDLKTNFTSHMSRIGLSDAVKLMDMPNEAAEKALREIKIRFLFIDGDHTRSGVERDIRLFFPKLIPGALVVFDDFSKNAPGVVEAVDKLLSERKFSRVLSYKNTIVLKC